MTHDTAKKVIETMMQTMSLCEVEKDALRTAVDVLEEREAVVRCKDCKGSTDFTDDPKLRGWKCRWHGGFHGGNWFCADGIRRDE